VPVSGGEGSSGGCDGGNTVFESSLLALINQERASNGVAALANNGTLASVARHTARIWQSTITLTTEIHLRGCQRQAFHIPPQRRTFMQATDQTTAPDAAFSGWMASEGHRLSMLNPEYTQAGVGYWCNASSTYGGYFTLDLIAK